MAGPPSPSVSCVVWTCVCSAVPAWAGLPPHACNSVVAPVFVFVFVVSFNQMPQKSLSVPIDAVNLKLRSGCRERRLRSLYLGPSPWLPVCLSRCQRDITSCPGGDLLSGEAQGGPYQWIDKLTVSPECLRES